MRVLFVLPRMVSGGVERVTLNLIGGFREAGVECALALRHRRGELLADADSIVAVHEVAANGLHGFVPNLSRLIREWRPSHIVTAFPDIAFLTWRAIKRTRLDVRLVHGIHNSHGRQSARSGVLGRLRFSLENRLAGFVYRRADALVAVSKGIRHEVLVRYRINPSRIVAIYNPVLRREQIVEVDRTRPRTPDRPLAMVTLGRLAHQKGFDLLIEAVATAQLQGDWRLDIWGEGRERKSLDASIDRRRLRQHVFLRGHADQPLEVLRGADLFVMSSRHEGLGNVLIEAMACGVPVIATDCPHGPAEIVDGGRFGVLVPAEDVPALARAISRFSREGSPVTAEMLAQRAADFTIPAAVDQWLSVLRSV